MNINEIETGDARELAKSIPDESVDLVFFDPPYLKQNSENGIYAWTAQEAARILKPGGFCLTYVGQMWKYECMFQLGKHLAYHWDYISFSNGYGTMIWSHHVIARH